MNQELIIRNYLKTLSVEDIANSVYMYGINFDTATIDLIISSINSLYEEVITLDRIVESGFVSETGARLPKDSKNQEIIIQDYSKKKDALLKILSNKNIFDLLAYYRSSNTQEKSEPTR